VAARVRAQAQRAAALPPRRRITKKPRRRGATSNHAPGRQQPPEVRAPLVALGEALDPQEAVAVRDGPRLAII
jgi:hypothetical protein